MRRWLLALVFCFLVLPAWAQSEAESLDPAAHAHAWRLYELYEQSPQQVGPAVRQSPKLAQRAFLSTFIYAVELFQVEDPDAEEAFEFAGFLAQQLASELGDTEPARLFQLVVSEDPGVEQAFEQYAVEIGFGGGGGGGEATGGPPEPFATTDQDPSFADVLDGSGELDPDLESSLALIVKIFRIVMAFTLQDPELILQELDTYPPIEESLSPQLQQALAAEGAGLDELRNVVDLGRLVTLADIGLLEEFEAEASEMLQRLDDNADRVSALLIAFRSALRQGRFDEARRLLARMEEQERSSKEPFSRLLSFAIATGRLQLEQAQGRYLEDAAFLAQGRQLWSRLASYDPAAETADNGELADTTSALGFWADEYRARGLWDEELLEQYGDLLARWLDASAQLSAAVNYEENPEDALDVMMFVLAILDQSLYLMESYLGQQGNEGAGEPDEIEGTLVAVAEMAQEIGAIDFNLERPGFPKVDYSEASLVLELQARSHLLKARLAQLDKAERIRCADEARRFLDGSKNPYVQIRYLLELGDLYRYLGASEKAAECLREGLSKAERFGYSEQELEAKVKLASLYGDRGDWRTASDYSAQARAMLEDSLSLPATNPRLARQLRQLTEEYTQVSVQSKLANNEPQQALQELVEGQQLQAASMGMGVGREARVQAVEVEKRKSEVNSLSQQTERLRTLPPSPTRDRLLQKTETLLADTRSKFLLESRKLRDQYASLYSQALRFDPLNLPDVQSALPPEVAVVQYFPTPDKLYIFLVTQDTFRLREVEIANEDLEKQIASLGRAIGRVAIEDTVLEESSRSLYDVLIRPVEEDLEGRDVLVLIPTGRLHVLPFAALKAPDGSYLLDRKLLLKLAKPTDFLRIASSSAAPVRSVVAFADATLDLVGAEEEGKRVAALFPDSKLFVGAEATKANFAEHGDSAEVLHLATHGQWDMQNSMNNYLMMAGNETLTQNEIFDMEFTTTSVVTLSACNTAMADRLDAGYVASLAEAFWLAGSQSVVATLWSVSDASSSELMSKFYQDLRDGSTKAEALISAQRKVRDTPGYEHPFYWAGFVLFGDWR